MKRNEKEKGKGHRRNEVIKEKHLSSIFLLWLSTKG